MKKRNWMKWAAGGVIIALAAGSYVAVAGGTKEYRVATVVSQEMTEVLETTGEVKSNDSRIYYGDFTAPIEVLAAEKGKTVEEGEQLVSFDVSELSLEAKQSALAVEAVDSQYQSTVKQNEKNTMIYQGAAMSEAAFAQLIAGQRDVIKELQAKVTKAANKQNDIAVLTSRVSAEFDKDNKEDLQKTLDGWKGEYKDMKVPEITAELAKQQVILTDMENYRVQYESQKEAADTRLIDESAQQEILVNRQSAALRKEDVEKTLHQASGGIIAEEAGVVSEVYVEEGATVSKGTPLFKIENSADMAVEVQISKYDIGKVRMGQEARITIAGNVYEGVVAKIDRVAVKDNTDKAKIPVTVNILEPDEYTYIGIEGDVDITLNEKENAQVLPIHAVYSDDESDYCYIVKDGRIQRQNLVMGIQNDTQVEVLEGLQTGDRVIMDAVTENLIGEKAKAVEEKEGDSKEKIMEKVGE